VRKIAVKREPGSRVVEATLVIERPFHATPAGQRFAAALLRLAAEAIGPVNFVVKTTKRHEYFLHAGMLVTAAESLEKGARRRGKGRR